ncbi:MAG: PAS domain-containing sensor histidine kinase [Gemmatimonadales bacterium]
MKTERRNGTDRRRPAISDRDAVRAIVERMADGVVVVSVDGLIRFANPAAERLFGRPAAALCGQPFGLPVVADESTEVELHRPGGDAVTAELRLVESDWERAPAILVSLRDITDRRQLEQERVARAKAEAASQAKSEFLDLMSHELRTPLNAVLGYTDLLELGATGPVTAAQQIQLSRIRASGRHLLDLVNEMIDLARAGSGELAVRRGTANATRTAADALAVVRPTAGERGVRLIEECQGNPEAIYAGDAQRAREILVHLLDNAIRFTGVGGEVEITCDLVRAPDPDARLHDTGPWVCWRVTDTGIGIDSAAAGKVFEPFVQVEAGHTRSADGSGLGLTVSRSLARLMGGEITLRSELGVGSCFTLWLPAASTAG